MKMKIIKLENVKCGSCVNWFESRMLGRCRECGEIWEGGENLYEKKKDRIEKILYVAYNKKERKYDSDGELSCLEECDKYESEVDCRIFDNPEEWESKKIKMILEEV